MQNTSAHFKENVRHALAQPSLKVALDRTTTLLMTGRARAVAGFPEFETACEVGRQIKDHTLKYLDRYLEEFERNAVASGAKIHWAGTAQEATDAVVAICRAHGAKSVTRSKSMLGEEINLPEALAAAGIERVETDLGEHILQLTDEPPSHIIAPAMHKTHEEVSDLFERYHHDHVKRTEIPELVESARRELRHKYFTADAGISGANFLIAETGSVVTVTNEGNAELTTALPKVHIVTAGIEKLVPTMEHCTVLLRLLARSALGWDISQYTTFYNGPKRSGDRDGPEEFHVVLVDNHRSEMLGGELRDILRCIRCGACLNHCPVFGAIGGHAYGGVYQGPMGSVLIPAMVSLQQAKDLPNACTLNGRCAEVCPVKIPLPDLLRRLRDREYRENLVPATTRLGLGLWAFAARRPWLYRATSRLGVRLLALLGRQRGFIRSLPGAGGWTSQRDMPAPQKGTFMALHAKRVRKGTP